MLPLEILELAQQIRPAVMASQERAHAEDMERLREELSDSCVTPWAHVQSPAELDAAIEDPNVTFVSFEPDASAELVGRLATVPRVTGLELFGDVSPEVLDAVASIRHLECLQFQHMRIPNGDCSALQALRNLKGIEFRYTNIKRGLARLVQNNSGLISISFHNTPAGERLLQVASSLPALLQLAIPFTRVRGGLCRTIVFQKRPENLDVSGIAFRDEDLERFVDPEDVHVLRLEYTQITDELVRRCREMAQLRRLKLLGTRVSPSAVKELCTARPDIAVHY